MPKHVRKSTLTQQQAKDTEKALLETQELAASLFESNLQLQAQVLDTQDAVAALFEMGGNV